MDKEIYNFPWSNGYESGLLFPAPIEVGSYTLLSMQMYPSTFTQFPAPREVDRYLYLNELEQQVKASQEFPVPLEVDR